MSANKTNKAAHKNPTANAAMGSAGDTFTAALMQRRARAREEADRLRNERLRQLREGSELPDGGDAA
jgi:hypothetical protein